MAKSAFLTRRRLPAILLAAGILGASGGLQAETRYVLPADLPPGMRLGDWLVSQGVYRSPAVLSWQVPGEEAAQRARKERLLAQLASLDTTGGAQGRWRPLLARLEAMPVTGRVILPAADPHLLQVRPGIDPVLAPGQRIVIGEAPPVITLLRADGTLCQLPHRAGAEARHYVEACGLSGAVDEAWVVQADGQVRMVSVADWNAAAQGELAPGAWLWAPPRDAGVPRRLSDALAAFLATQAPASLAASTNAVPPVAEGLPLIARPARDLTISASDWGSIGLLQTPTARLGQAGRVSASVSHVSPYTRYGAMLQPFDWLEAGFLYTDISNILYGSQIAGDQSYKDKQVDVKVRVLRETELLPDLAVGARDIGGTGLFSGEYVVANKRFGDFDISLGLGWGYVGGRGNLKNPLSIFGSKFDTRPPPQVGQGGEFNTGTYFRGPTALFGGVQYHTPWPRWVVKAELDGNNYQQEPYQNNQEQKTPLNVGVVYQGDWADVSFGYERGDKAMLAISLHGRVDQLRAPKFGPPPVPVEVKPLPPAAPVATPTPAVSAGSVANARLAAARQPVASRLHEQTLVDISEQSAWYARRIVASGTRWQVDFDESEGLYLNERIDRAVSVLHRDAPLEVSEFLLRFLNKDVEVAIFRVDRRNWMLAQTRLLPPGERQPDRAMLERAKLPPELQAVAGDAQAGSDMLVRAAKRFDGNLSFGYQQTLGGPDGFLLYSLSGQANATARLWSGAWLAGSVSAQLLTNYGNYKYTAPSQLPRVRTYIGEYMTTSTVTIPYFQFTQMGRVGSDHYVSFYGGLLETMFGGVGAEWLYRPAGSRLAIGLDVNEVRQRSFEQDFSFRDYQVTTSHLTAYWDTGWQDVLAKVSFGRYLAGDTGVTVDLSRVFGNGVKIGAYATKTDASAEQFGEGSFDKGIYLTIPFDAMFTRDLGGKANIVWTPLTRDGGQKLNRQFSLYDMTALRDARALEFAPPPLPNALPYKVPAGAEPGVGKVDVVPITAGLVEQMNTARAKPAVASLPPGSPQPYRLGVTDVLRVLVWGYPEFGNVTSPVALRDEAEPAPQSPDNRVSGRAVDKRGEVYVPLVGPVMAAGLTVPEFRQRLSKALEEYIVDPQVEVDVVAYRSQRVLMAGEVRKPGVVPVTDVPLRVTDALALSGGATPAAALETVSLLRDGQETAIDLQRILEDGDQRQNVLLRDGDQITVPDRQARKVFVMGEVLQPRAQVMRRGTMSLTEVLADAGGPNPLSARAGEVFVMRRGGDGRPNLYQLDASQPTALVLADRFPMAPRDLVFVNATDFTRVSRTIAQLFPVFQSIQSAATIKP